MDNFKSTLQSFEENIAVLKKAVLQWSPFGSDAPSKIWVPEPKGFNGNKNAKELENFLWDMEQFFKVAHISDAERVSITSIYLIGDAKPWWCKGGGWCRVWKALDLHLGDFEKANERSVSPYQQNMGD